MHKSVKLVYEMDNHTTPYSLVSYRILSQPSKFEGKYRIHDNFERNQVSRVPKARIEMMTFFRSSGHWGRDIVTKPILLTKWFGIIR